MLAPIHSTEVSGPSLSNTILWKTYRCRLLSWALDTRLPLNALPTQQLWPHFPAPFLHNPSFCF